MAQVTFEQLLDAGCHFGHLRRKWNPHMAPYIFMEKNGIHIIDLHKTTEKLDEACAAAKQIAKSGRKILFVATKKQAKDTVAELVKTVGCLTLPSAGPAVCSPTSSPSGRPSRKWVTSTS